SPPPDDEAPASDAVFVSEPPPALWVWPHPAAAKTDTAVIAAIEAQARQGIMFGRTPCQKVTHLFVHGFGVLAPEIALVTLTPVPVGMKFTLPGPRVTFVYAAVTCDGQAPSKTKLWRVTLFRCVASYPSSVTVGVFDPPLTTWTSWNLMFVY